MLKSNKIKDFIFGKMLHSEAGYDTKSISGGDSISCFANPASYPLSTEPPLRVACSANISVDGKVVRAGSSSVRVPETAPAVPDRGERPRVVWSIAGHDPSSGAGFTADQLTFAAHGLFAATVATALTAQSTVGVAAVEPIRPGFIRLALETLFADLPPVGVKIGMLGSPEVAQVVAGFLATLPQHAGTGTIPVVLDPVLVSSSGRSLFPAGAIELLHTELLPQVTFATPNYAELAVLTVMPVRTESEAREAGDALGRRYPQLNLVVTGGDRNEPTELLRLVDGSWSRFPGERVASTSTHGTGCAFSSALLAQLVLGTDPAVAVAAAKYFVTEGIRRAKGVGQGRGPLDLLWPRNKPA
jgi:hydroxymethylpyrimidine/phosphomethylpyrimidine kinase